MVEERSKVTPVSELTNHSKNTAQKLLNHYVKVQGLSISQVWTLSEPPSINE